MEFSNVQDFVSHMHSVGIPTVEIDRLVEDIAKRRTMSPWYLTWSEDILVSDAVLDGTKRGYVVHGVSAASLTQRIHILVSP